MGAEVFDGYDAALRATIKHHFFTADLPTQGFLGDFIGCAGDVPSVFGVHGNSLAG
jgi:hypothetical protein